MKMINKKTAQKWSKMAKEQMEKNWKIDEIVKTKVEIPEDILNAVVKYVDKKITGYAKVTGNTSVVIDLTKIRKSITANENALAILGKHNLNIDSYIFGSIKKNLFDNKFKVIDLTPENKFIVDWSWSK
jgi:hypothetical protein